MAGVAKLEWAAIREDNFLSKKVNSGSYWAIVLGS